MNMRQKETEKEKVTPAKKSLSQLTKPKCNIEQARMHFFGACLLDATYSHCLPASIYLSDYGAFTLAMIQQGLGIDAIVRHLEAVGIDEAHILLSSALDSIPDGADLGKIFWLSVNVLAKGVSIS